MPPPPRAGIWPIAVLALVALGLATVCLVVSVTRAESGSSTSYTGTQKNAAQANLCERFKLAADAAGIETNGSDIALARISATNAAVILESTVSGPALNDKYRSAALALASSYQTMTAEGSRCADETRFRASIDAVNARTQTLRDLCRD
jgi:hypothetical protein